MDVMHNALRFAHAMGAILTGIVVCLLAVAINVQAGSALGATSGMLSLVLGYLVGFASAGGIKTPLGINLLVVTVIASWVLALVSIVSALLSLF